jgi:flagellar protein FliO/FliZ
MVGLAVQLVFSLAVVVGMILVLVKLGGKRFRGSADSLVRVVHRQPLSRTASVSVVTVGSRVLVLGTTEQRVELLTELDPEELDPEELDPEELDPEELDVVDPVGEPAAASVVQQIGPVRPVGPATTGRRAAGPRRTPRLGPRPTARHALPADTALAGSVLSPQTWKQAFAAATGREQAAS